MPAQPEYLQLADDLVFMWDKGFIEREDIEEVVEELHRLYALNAEQQVVMKQALEALEEVDNCTSINDYDEVVLGAAYDMVKTDEAITALREALHGSISPNARKT